MQNEKSVLDKNIVGLMESHGSTVKRGQLSVENGKYYITIDKKKIDLDPRLVISPEPIEKVVKEGSMVEVEAIYATDNSLLGIIFKKIRILCYKPVPPFLKVLEDKVRIALIEKMVMEERMPAALGKQFIQDIQSVR